MKQNSIKQNNIKQAMQGIELFQKIRPETCLRLSECAAIKNYQRGAAVYRDKEEIRTIYFIISGLVTLYKIDSQGEKKVIFIYGKQALLNEDIFGQNTAAISCEVREKAVLLCFPKQMFVQAAVQDSALAKAVMESMAIKLRRLYRQLKNTSPSLHVDKKIAAKLWKLAKDHGIPDEKGIRINVDMSITYLAEMLGSKRETVSRQIKLLVRQGVLIIHKNSFIIPDYDALSSYFKGEAIVPPAPAITMKNLENMQQP